MVVDGQEIYLFDSFSIRHFCVKLKYMLAKVLKYKEELRKIDRKVINLDLYYETLNSKKKRKEPTRKREASSERFHNK